jgi:hypothetical protein
MMLTSCFVSGPTHAFVLSCGLSVAHFLAAEMTRMSFGLCGLVALQIVAWLATGLVLLSYITTLLWQAVSGA